MRRIHWKKSTLLENPVLKKNLVKVEVVEPKLFVPDACIHFEYAVSVMATRAVTGWVLDGWEMLTREGVVRAVTPDTMLELLALIEPLNDRDLLSQYESGDYQVLYASDLKP